MENRSHALIAGFFTVIMLTAVVLGALWLGRDEIVRTSYEIATRMPITGLNPQASVRYKGLKVGNVTQIEFDPRNPGQILLRLEVVPDTPVTVSTFATLGYQGVTGIAFVQLDDQEGNHTAVVAAENGLPRIPLRPGLLQNVEQKGLAILQQTEELGQRLNRLLSDENQKNLSSAITHLDQTAQATRSAINSLQPTLEQLPQVVSKASASFDAFKSFSVDARKLSNNLSDLSTNLQGSDGPIAKLTQTIDLINLNINQQTLPDLHRLSTNGSNSLRKIDQTVDGFSQRPQSILFGNPAPAPGPGEAGFVAPTPPQ